MEISETQRILMLGESDVGKTHYGGQLLKRLMNSHGQIRMNGAATNLEPFQKVMDSLNEGRLADHTATTIYDESVWPIIDDAERKARLIWPDYGGEQIRNIIDERRIPNAWGIRITQSSAWLLLIRPQKIRVDNDVFSRPLTSLRKDTAEVQETDRNEMMSGTGSIGLSDQARLIELLQMLIQTYLTCDEIAGHLPQLLILLTCWDEMQIDTEPVQVFRQRLPMLYDFVSSNWEDSVVLGLSALGRRLDKTKSDMEYVNRGSESFGYMVLENGTHCDDLTLPIHKLLSGFP